MKNAYAAAFSARLGYASSAEDGLLRLEDCRHQTVLRAEAVDAAERERQPVQLQDLIGGQVDDR